MIIKNLKGKFRENTKKYDSELGTVISSDLSELDDYIKSYPREQPDMTFTTAVKIILRNYITPELIVQLNVFKDYLEKINPFLFLEVFGKQRKDRKIPN